MAGSDTKAPYITKINPASGAKDIAIASDIVIDFSEPVVFGSGSIQFINMGTGASLKIPVNDKQLSLNGSTLTINPIADLALGSEYTIYIDAGFVKDEANNLIDYAKSLFYTISDSTGKVVPGAVNPPSQQVPPPGQPGGPLTGPPPGAPPGNSPGSSPATPPGTSPGATADGGSPGLIESIGKPDSPYASAITSVDANGVSTESNYYPTLTNLFEYGVIYSNSTDVSINPVFKIKLSEPVTYGVGRIYVTKNGSPLISISAGDYRLTLADSTLTVGALGNLSPYTTYSVEFDRGFFVDADKNPSLAIYYGFTTGAAPTTTINYATAPYVTSFNPVDGSVAVKVDTNFNFELSEASNFGKGNIYVKNYAGESLLTIPAGDSQISLMGTKLTIDPLGNLLPNTHYYISVDAGFLKDLDGNESAAFSGYDFITVGQNSKPTGAVTIEGIAAQGQTLVAVNSLYDADGMGVISYAWFIDGEKKSTGQYYLLKQADVGKTLKVEASYLDPSGANESVFSQATSKVTDANDKPDLLNITLPGRVITDFKDNTGYLHFQSLETQSDGKIICAGINSVFRYNSNGSLDKTFNSAGLMDGVNDFTLKIDGIQVVEGGKILIAVSGEKPRLIRLNINGTLDKTFSDDGWVEFNNYKSNAPIRLTEIGSGKILINTLDSKNTPMLFQLNEDGTFNQEFGIRNFASEKSTATFSVSDEKFILIRVKDYDEKSFAASSIVERYSNDGKRDYSLTTDDVISYIERTPLLFGSGSDYRNKYFYTTDMVLNGNDADIGLSRRINNVKSVIQSIAKSDAGDLMVNWNFGRIDLMSKDKSFGSDGLVTLDISQIDDFRWYRNNLKIQPDGKILVAGDVLRPTDKSAGLSFFMPSESMASFGMGGSGGAGTGFAMGLARFNADGTLDQDFGTSPQDNGFVTHIKGGAPVVLNPLVQVEDLDYQAAGTYAGATLTLKRHGGVSAQDTFSLSTQGTTLSVLANNDITNSGQVIGNLKSEAGTLSLAFKGAGATQTVVNQVLQHIQYQTTSLATPSSVQIDWTFSDGIASEIGLSNVALIDLSKTVKALAKHWKESTQTPTETKKADAVNLTDAIAILKMIVGLNVNSNNTSLSPYQAIAADFDQSGDVGLTDAIGVLKMVVGLSAPTPTWKYYDDTKLASAYTSTQSLNPKGWTTTAVMSDTGTADSSVKLVGVLTGDVDGSWTGV